MTLIERDELIRRVVSMVGDQPKHLIDVWDEDAIVRGVFERLEIEPSTTQGAVDAVERIGDAINAVESGGGTIPASVHEAFRAALATVRGQ